MKARHNLLRLTALSALLAGLMIPLVAQAEPASNPCRRPLGTDEWTRRCAQHRPRVDLEAYCRRVFGTDEWTRRCSQLYDDPVSACRRLLGTDEWTRRCAPHRPDPVRPEPVRPDQVRPEAESQAPEAVPVSPRVTTALPEEQPVRPATRG